MQKNSFIYKGYYYEYSKEELEPEVYLKELEPSLIQLLEKRKNKIKDIMSSSTVDAAVTSEFYMCKILELEDEIEQYMYNSKQYFEWYHSTIGEKTIMPRGWHHDKWNHCKMIGIECLPTTTYTVINGKDRFFFGPLARRKN